MHRTIDSHTTYLERIAKLIPAEIVAAHLTIQGFVYNEITYRDIIIEISAGTLLFALPFYLWHALGIKKCSQISLTMASFVVWVLAVSLPVHQRSGIAPILGSIILILWTTVIPIFTGSAETVLHPDLNGDLENEAKPSKAK